MQTVRGTNVLPVVASIFLAGALSRAELRLSSSRTYSFSSP